MYENHRKNLIQHCKHFTFLSRQKLIKNAKNGPFWRGFKKLMLAVKQCYQTALRNFKYLLSDMNLLVSELKKKIFFSFLLQFAILVVFSYVQNSCVIEWNKTILQAYIFYFMCVHMALLHSRLFMPIQWLIGCSNFVVLMDLFSKDF